MKKLLIMAFESPGLYNDALIYESAFDKYFDVKILMPKDIMESVVMLKDNISDIYFFLEKIFDINIYDINYKDKVVKYDTSYNNKLNSEVSITKLKELESIITEKL